MRTLIMILLLAATASAAADKLAYTVSSTNLNSMSCPSGAQVSDVFISERAQLKAETRADRLFFEFTATVYEVEGGGYRTTTYATEATTIVLFCGETEYTIKLTPRKIDGVSIELPIHEAQLRKSELDGLRREEQISKLIELTLLNKLTSTKTIDGGTATKIGDKEFYLRKVHTIAGYNVKEVYVYSKELATVTEDELLSLDFIKYPVAATLHDSTFAGWLRLVVIEDAFGGSK